MFVEKVEETDLINYNAQSPFMPSHNVKFSLPERELGKVDARFFIYEDGKKLGEITISRGAFEYYPMNAQKPVKMTWTQFDRAMKEYK